MSTKKECQCSDCGKKVEYLVDNGICQECALPIKKINQKKPSIPKEEGLLVGYY
ncbi:hypothetical protein [Paenibacillus foliorum]|uniref:hypothetical protein n=1 Tax=Paenibacillus foliorum TaxID=2654974 RepID=UPI001491DA1F|nr:hypothetical protein [Paenibacillus foliorum]